MSRRPASPWLGGPGARWAQALLLVLHVALLVAIAVSIWTFFRVLPRLDFATWQIWAFLGGSAACGLFFGLRTVRIARDLLGGPAPAEGDEDEDTD